MNQKKSEGRRLLVRWICALGMCISACSAEAVILEWDRNPETNILGYRIYTGRQSRVYDSVQDVGANTLAELATMPGTRYYAITAYNTEGLESDFSDEVFFTAPTVNSPPTAQPDQYSTTKNVALNVAMNGGLLANDSDLDGDVLSVLLVATTTHGALSLNANGSFSYTPAGNYTGTDSFSYRANDGQSTSPVTTVTITVDAAPNSTPVARADQYTTTRNIPLNITASAGVLANDTDSDGDALAAILSTSTAHGTVVLNLDGSFIYTPAQNYVGSDSFSYRVSDGKASSAVAIVTLNVNAPPNNPPVSAADQYVTTKNSPLNISAGSGLLANDSDADSDPLTVALVSSVTHGTLSVNINGAFIYIPTANYVGSDSFSYRANDGKAMSGITVVTINVNAPPNTPPVAVADSYITLRNVPLNVSALSGVLANDSDVDGDPLTALLTSSVTHGALSLNANGTFNYTPATSYVGSDEFSYRVSDGKATSAVVVVAITVNAPPNSAPTSAADQYVTTKNIPLNISAAGGVLANDSDIDGDPLVAQLISSVSHGALSLSENGSFSYTPAPNYIGSDAFIYRVSDGKTNSAQTIVTIVVNGPPNTTPISSPDNYVTTRNGTLSISAVSGVLTNDFDADGDGLIAFLVASVSHGTLLFSANGSFTYTPSQNFAGVDSFSYQTSDGKATSAVTVVTITIHTPPNSPPIAQPDQYITTEGVPLNISEIAGVLANDSDADADLLAAVLVETVSHGTLAFAANGGFIYTPEPGFVGTDFFSYFGVDRSATSAVAVVTITINTLPNSTPTAQADHYITTKNVPLNVLSLEGVLANDVDLDGDALVALPPTAPANGTLTFNANGSFIYTPSPNFAGDDSFSYQVTDGKATSAVAIVTITTLSNSLPVARPDHYVAIKNVPLSVSLTAGVLANDTDTDGSGLTAILVTSVTNGTLTLNANGGFSYTLNQDFIGIDSFSYCAADSQGTSSVTVVTIIVNASGNRIPVAQPEHYNATNNATLSIPSIGGVLSNDVDADGDGLVAVLVNSTAHGTLSLNADGSFNYTPQNFVGLDSFGYSITDGKATSAVAVVQITVSDAPLTPPPPPPPPASCFDCFAKLDAVLWRRSNAFRVVIPARLAVPTNVTCPQAAVFVFGAIAKSLAAINDTEMNEALDSTAECLASVIKDELNLRLEKAGTLAPSKWTTTASNQVASSSRTIGRIATIGNALGRAKLLASGVGLLSKTDRTLAKGDLAPAFIASRVFVWDVFQGREKHKLRFIFGETSFVAEDMAGTPMATGSYVFSRTAWNQGSLLLHFDNEVMGYHVGETVTVRMTFSPARNRLTSQGMRGYFTVN